jgi:molybdate transport system ATP-binding protein
MSLSLDVTKRLGAFSYAAAFSAETEIVVLFGHSGAGKSLTLQFVAGLVRPDAGRILVDGRPVFDSAARVDLPPQERGVGYVVQDLALFRHMTVAENIGFGVPGPARARRVGELVDLLGLAGLERRKPATLSGGQQQRVALARALARDARLLLLDEPFSALDESLRQGLRHELLRLRAELGLTILFVTHDLREAHLLADRLAVFDEGRLLQYGPRDEVFRRPASRRVAHLTGVANVFAGRVLVAGCDTLSVDVEGLELRVEAPPGAAFSPGEPVDVVIRAERVNLRRDHGGTHPANFLRAAIVEEFSYGSAHTIRLRPLGPGPALEVELAARPYEVLDIAHRREWTVELPPGDLHVMRASAMPSRG